MEILFLMSGKAEVTVGEDCFVMEKNTVILINCEKKHSIHVLESGIVCRITIEYKTLSNFLGTDLFLFWCNSAAEPQGDYEGLLKLIKRLIAMKLTRGDQEDFATYSLYCTLLDHLIKKYLIDQRDVRFRESFSENDQRIHEITCYMQGNYNADISLNELAEKLYLSNAYLSRFFKKNFGQSFKDYLSSIRLLHAVDDLLGTEKNITRIAMDNGFSSVSRFNQVFKDAYQVSPLIYREQNKAAQIRKEEAVKEMPLLDEVRKYVLEERILDLDEQEMVRRQVIDLSQSKPLNRNWNRVMNVGELRDLRTASAQGDLLKIHSEIGITYVRFWNLFDQFQIDTDDSMMNFSNIDRAIEFLLHNGMKPFIVFGGKDRSIMRNHDDTIYSEGSKECIWRKDLHIWQSVLPAFCEHMMDAFGIDEVSTWVIELRQPKKWDLTYSENSNEYFQKWFLYTVQTLRTYYPHILIGGCENTVSWDNESEAEVQEMIDFWKEIKFRPSFFSITSVDMENKKPSANPEFLRDQIFIAKRLLQANCMQDIPIMVTEWSNTLSTRSIYNESCYKGAYVIQNCTMNAGLADKIVYWNASDIISEYHDTADVLYGGVGLLNKNGIPKPVFHAFAFLSEMYRYQVFCSRNLCVTTDRNNNYRIICNNMKDLNYSYSLALQNETVIDFDSYEQYFEDLDMLSIRLHLIGIRPGTYEIRRRRVGKESGSIMDELERMGSVQTLKFRDMEYLEHICRPKLTLQTTKIEGEQMDLAVELTANTFEMIELNYRPGK